jgi:hypothetical protein
MYAFSVLALVAGSVYAEGERGRYSGFGARLNEGPTLALNTVSAAAPVQMTSYNASSEKIDRYQAIDEIAQVRFRLEGLPAAAQLSDYRVSWKFDDAHKGSGEQELRPTQISTVEVRYNSVNSNHRVVELRVVSADGRWSGVTKFPAFGRPDPTLEVADDNVLLVRMKAKEAVN